MWTDRSYKQIRGPWTGGLTLILLFCLMSLACSSKPASKQTASAPAPPKRNASVLLITLDTLRADHLGCYGRKGAVSPNIDALAQQGVRFARAFVQVPLTTPSHASILTGSYPQVHKLRDNGGFILDKSIPTLASVTKQAGLDTAAFVGAAVLHHQYGLNRGFGTYADDMRSSAKEGLLPGVVAEVRADVVTERALAWLRNRNGSKSGNFFLWVHYYDPHFPYDPPEPFASRFSKDQYAGEIAFTDEQVGRLLKGLSDLGLREKTLVVLMADHGEGLGDHGEFTHGVFLYDATMHVPLIMAGPDLPAGVTIEQQVRSIDVMPTALDYLGLSPGAQVQGQSLLPSLLERQSVPARFAYMETLYPKTSHGWSELRAIRTDDWKLIVAPTPELYDLQTDASEQRNVRQEHLSKAEELEKHVWEIAGPRESLGRLEREPVSDQTMRELQSLGYASAGARRELRIDLSGPDPKDRVHVLKWLDRASDLMNHDRFAAAASMLEKAVAEDPTNPALYGHLGTCYQQLRQFQKALQLYQQAIQNGADTDQTHAETGEVYIRLGDPQKAAFAMEKAAEMNLTNLQNLTNLATLYLNLGRLPEAQRTVKAILTQNSRHGGAYNVLGIIEIQRGQPGAARGYFEKAVEYDPNLSEPYMNLALLAEESGQTQLAVGYYRKFLEHADPTAHREFIPKVKAAIKELGGG
ncbi:MAG: sulfatase-like hydrolase/transferase [Acidobacteriota bacterium]